MLVNQRVLRIEWGQCDPAGIVFYPQYFTIFDTSTGWLFERTGLSPSVMRRKYGIVGLPIVDVGAKFFLACRFDDEIFVESSLRRRLRRTIQASEYPHAIGIDTCLRH